MAETKTTPVATATATPAAPAAPAGVKVKLVKGQDYTVYKRVFKKDEVVVVTAEQAQYLLHETEGFFAEVKSEPVK